MFCGFLDEEVRRLSDHPMSMTRREAFQTPKLRVRVSLVLVLDAFLAGSRPRVLQH